MEQVDELFAACDINGDGAVSKIEFLEFLREHKPKSACDVQAHPSWSSVPRACDSYGFFNACDSIDAPRRPRHTLCYTGISARCPSKLTPASKRAICSAAPSRAPPPANRQPIPSAVPL